MPTLKSGLKSGLAAAVFAPIVIWGVSSGALAFDPEKTFKADEEPRTILRYGFKALKNGNMKDAIGAFRFGAEKEDLASQWKLARMLQKGAGLPKDDLAAYRLYAKIANRYAESFPRAQDLPYVSHAVVALGRYSLTGIRGSYVQADPRRAEDHFYRAAALYKDREAQFQLGQMYRSGVLGTKQPRSAVRWLGLSARKGHRIAQAQLGEMLFYGEGVRARPVRGLVFMTRAAANSAGTGFKSVISMQRKAFDQASDAQRDAAIKIMKKLNPDAGNEGRSFGLELLPRRNGPRNASQSD